MNLSQYKVKLHFTELQLVFTSSTPPPREIDIDTTLEEIFKHISVRISGRINDNQFVEKMSSIKSCYYVDTQQALIVKSQLVALGVLEEVDDGNAVYEYNIYDETEFMNASFIDCNVNRVNFSKYKFSKVIFSGCKFENVRFNENNKPIIK